MTAPGTADQTLATRLAAEVARQLEIQARLGGALMRELEQVAEKGRPVFSGGEVVDTKYVPDRDWARCYGHYQRGNADMLREQREAMLLRAKLRVDGAPEPLTDEQYQAELVELGREALATITREDLAVALAERGLEVVEVGRDEAEVREARR